MKLTMYFCSSAVAVLLLSAAKLNAATLVDNDLLSTSTLGTGWQECGTGNEVVDLTSIGGGGCAYHEFPANPDTEYVLTCAGTSTKYASITLAFSDENFNSLISDSREILDESSGSYSVTLTSPANTVYGAVGIYAEHGSSFQDCVVIESQPQTQPTLGSIAGNVWFDENGDSVSDAVETPLATSIVNLMQGGSVIASTNTDASGDYYFGQLNLDQTYIVEFIPLDASLQLSPQANDSDAVVATGHSGQITLSAAEPNVTDVDAGFTPVPVVVPPADYNVCGIAWADDNGDGSFNAVDSVIGSLEVQLVNVDTGAVTTLETDSAGAYVFDGLEAGNYSLNFDSLAGYEFVAPSSTPLATGSYADAGSGQTPTFNLPADSNSGTNDPCTLQDANAGFVLEPTAIDPTTAEDDEVAGLVGESLTIEILGNDAPCTGSGSVDVLGHNVPGTVVYNVNSGSFSITDTTSAGTYSIEYGLRGVCGSYDTALVTVTLTDPSPLAETMEFNNCKFGNAREIVELLEFEPNTSNAVLAAFEPPVSVVTDCGLDLTAGMGWLQGTAEELNSISTTPVPYQTNDDRYTWGATFDQNMQTSCPSNNTITVTNADNSVYTVRCKTTKSPIAVDIDGSGSLQRIAGLFLFDIDGDGTHDRLTEWFSPSDGILVVANVKGEIDGHHLFGDLGGAFSDGYEKLAQLDMDNSGHIDGDELAELAIWTDSNSNAKLDAGELAPLKQFSIHSLSTTHQDYKSTGILKNGSVVLTEDLWFPIAADELAVHNPEHALIEINR